MAYYQKGLDGSGTESDPFVVKSYEDWVSIDARYTVDLDPPFYRLDTDIDMSSHGGYLIPKDFYFGSLNMDDHSIISPRIAVTKFLVRNCNIYSNDLEEIGYSGETKVKGGVGQILDIRGTEIESIFQDCTFKRMLISVNTENMHILNPTALSGLFERVQTEQCHFVINNIGYMEGLFKSAYQGVGGYPFVDTLFEFNGDVFDGPLFDFGYNNVSDDDKMLNRCMIGGKVDCEYLSYAYSSCPYPMVKGMINDCVFDIYGMNDVNQKGYGGYADYVSDEYLSIALRPEDSGCFIKNQNGVTLVSDLEMRNPTYLKSIGFDVKNINKE